MSRTDELIWSQGILEDTIVKYGNKPEWVKELEDINAELEVLFKEEYFRVIENQED